MYSDKGDFLINEKYVFEIGGKISPENKLKVLKIPLSPQTILSMAFRTKYHYGCLDFVLIDGF
jgi:hypothetical protein